MSRGRPEDISGYPPRIDFAAFLRDPHGELERVPSLLPRLQAARQAPPGWKADANLEHEPGLSQEETEWRFSRLAALVEDRLAVDPLPLVGQAVLTGDRLVASALAAATRDLDVRRTTALSMLTAQRWTWLLLRFVKEAYFTNEPIARRAGEWLSRFQVRRPTASSLTLQDQMMGPEAYKTEPDILCIYGVVLVECVHESKTD